MKSFLFSAAIFVFSSCQNQFSASLQQTNSTKESVITDVVDFQAQRLSGSRVMISWHATPNKNQHDFLVMRRLGTSGLVEKVATIKPRLSSEVNDYALTDINECADSSYYSIMQVDDKGVKYFSESKGVKGKAR